MSRWTELKLQFHTSKSLDIQLYGNFDMNILILKINQIDVDFKYLIQHCNQTSINL